MAVQIYRPLVFTNSDSQLGNGGLARVNESADGVQGRVVRTQPGGCMKICEKLTRNSLAVVLSMIRKHVAEGTSAISA